MEACCAGRLTGRSVAITGGGGFVGSHLIGALLRAGAAVTVLGPTPLGRAAVVDAIRSGRTAYEPSALAGNRYELVRALDGCDSLIHLAYGFPRSGNNLAKLEQEVRSNLLATIRLLDAAERTGVQLACFASSVSVYAPPGRGVSEDGPIDGSQTPYASAKVAQEWAFQQWSRLTGSASAILRLSSVYGPGETVGRAIPNFIRAALAGQFPTVNGEGTEPFDPIFVQDVSEAFVAATALEADGIFNIGTGVARKPREVARLVLELCGRSGTIRENRGVPERGSPVCDVSHATDTLGFVAATPLETGLRQEIAWFRSAGDN